MTPLELNIILHYYCCTTDFRDLDLPTISDSVGAFLDARLLEIATATVEVKYVITRRGRCFVEALKKVPLPQRRVIYEVPGLHKEEEVEDA